MQHRCHCSTGRCGEFENVCVASACLCPAREDSFSLQYNMCLCFRLLGLAGHEAKSLLTLLKANAISLSPTPRRDDEKGCIVSAYLFARGCFLDTSVLSLTARGWRAWGKPDLSNIEIFLCLYKILYSSILGCRCIFFCGKTAAHGTNQLNNNCSHIIYFTFLPPPGRHRGAHSRHLARIYPSDRFGSPVSWIPAQSKACHGPRCSSLACLHWLSLSSVVICWRTPAPA